MENIQFDGFTLKLKDIAKEEKNGEVILYITDCEINADDFDTFEQFIWDHSKPGKYFATTLNGESFYGRFGQFIFSRHGHIYKLRLIFVKSSADEEKTKNPFNFVMHDHSYANLFEKVVHQEIIIERLLNALKDKNILSNSEITDLGVVFENDKRKPYTELKSEVEDLDKYLQERNDTIAEFKS